MTKYCVFIGLIIIVSMGAGCNQYRSFTNATKVGQLSGNPFMYNLSKSVLKNMNTLAKSKGLRGEKLNLLSNLSTVFTTEESKESLKNMLMTTYQISPKKINNPKAVLLTVKDVIDFVAKNGRGFTFYRSS